MDRHLALLHFDRLEVVLHCGGQVWCYLFVNHHLDISTFVCLFVWSRLGKVYLCLGQAVVPILALAQVCLRHQLVPLLHVQVFVSHLIKTSSSAAEWHLWELATTEVYDRGSITVQLLRLKTKKFTF